MAKKTISSQSTETTETPTAPVETTTETTTETTGTETSANDDASTTEESKESAEETQPSEPKEEESGGSGSFEPGESETTKDPQTLDIDVEKLKGQGFITQVVTPEKLTKDNLATYVTQVGVASELYKELEKDTSEKE